MPRGRHRASFGQVFEFDRRKIVAYRDCGLSFNEIGQSVGRNQATVMRICHPLNAGGNNKPTKPIAPTSLHHCP
ncbi:hypothetical protein TNCV_1613551 [Trichonephila clavipes]|nr:hypothetical protein TNCV_1613551 [Trichonephila clavipes]